MAKATKTPEPEVQRTPQWVILCDKIDDGDFDEGLTEIARTITSRLETVDSRRARRLLVSLAVGSRVMITNKPTPRYLEGMVGTITEIDAGNSAARVELDHLPESSGRGRPSSNGPSKKLVMPIVHLVLMKDGDISPSELDDSDIGDDSEYEEDDDD